MLNAIVVRFPFHAKELSALLAQSLIPLENFILILCFDSPQTVKKNLESISSLCSITPRLQTIAPETNIQGDRVSLAISYELAQFLMKSEFDHLIFLNCPEIAFYPCRLRKYGFLVHPPSLYVLNQKPIHLEPIPTPFDFTSLIEDDVRALTFSELKELPDLNSWLSLQESSPIKPQRKPPSFSICIPTYNRSQFLRECLNSVLSQTLPPSEILICDDGSTDPEVRNVIQEFESKFPIVRGIYQENRYVGAARNALMRESASEYLILLDDDNLAHRWMVEAYSLALAHNPTDILVSPVDLFSDDQPKKEGQRIYFLGNSTVAGHIVNIMGDASLCVRRSVALQLQYVEAHGIGYEDWEFLLWAQSHSVKIDTLPVSVYRYRQSQSGSMRQNTPLVQNLALAFHRLSKSEPTALSGLSYSGALQFQLIADQILRKRNSTHDSAISNSSFQRNL